MRGSGEPRASGPRRAVDGARAESLAARFLEDQGLAIVERNFRRRVGEVDLIARDGDTLVFVEVRLRRHVAYGGAAASISYAKQAKIAAAANLYLARLRRTPPCRFDAIVLDGLEASRIEWLRDVFTA